MNRKKNVSCGNNQYVLPGIESIDLQGGGGNSPEVFIEVPAGSGEKKTGYSFLQVKCIQTDFNGKEYERIIQIPANSNLPVSISVKWEDV